MPERMTANGSRQLLFTIDENVTIEAYAEREGYLQSETVRASYTVKVENDLENINQNVHPCKVMRNGIIYIEQPDGTVFTAEGKRL